jgi:hypothetical protein
LQDRDQNIKTRLHWFEQKPASQLAWSLLPF